MMMKNFKLFLTYSTIIALLGSSGYMKTCRDKSKDFLLKTKNYISDFHDDEFKIAAHRGYTQNAVENTISAFADAYDANFVDYIELDARLSADGKLVVVHNSSVKTAQMDSLSIEKTNFNEIYNEKFRYTSNKASEFFESFFSNDEGIMIQEKVIKSFGKDFSIPALNEAIEICGDKPILLDLKFNENQEEFFEALKCFLQGYRDKKIILQSADLETLAELQKLLPQYKYLAIVDSIEDFEKCDSFEMLGVRKNLINTSEASQALSDGKELSVWTINTIKQLDAVVDAVGDDATKIIYVTDYPTMVATHLHDISMQKKKITN